MKKIALMECNLDLLTLSLSYVFFETLVLKSAVNKMNRKVCAGASLILAAKLNDVKGMSLSGLIEVCQIIQLTETLTVCKNDRNFHEMIQLIIFNEIYHCRKLKTSFASAERIYQPLSLQYWLLQSLDFMYLHGKCTRIIKDCYMRYRKKNKKQILLALMSNIFIITIIEKIHRSSLQK